MIVICEPICRVFSHEKVNSGFIYGLRLAFPDDRIRFYADVTHIEAIRTILAHDNVEIENIEYVPIVLSDSTTLRGAIHYYQLFKRIFAEVIDLGTNKIFFLSYSPVLIYLIKRLKQRPTFGSFKFTFVLHGDFESIKGDARMTNPLISPHNYVIKNSTLFDRIRDVKPKDVARKIYRSGRRFFQICSTFFNLKMSISQWFPTKKILLWRDSPDFKYIALSEQVVGNAKKYIDTNRVNIHTIVLPTNFAAPISQPGNKYVKFAIFGYGSSAVLRVIADKLSQKEIKRQYEIRIIGMDNTGLSGYPNIICPSAGRPLTRQDMEKYAKDVDVFMILYHKGQYQLTCSGTILEAISNSKPVLHFDNDCINSFNRPNNPIGICCNNMDEYVERVVDIITNYETYIPQFQLYRRNIMKLREALSVKSSVPRIRNSFVWES